ncbi:hypothetical protein GCM10027169_17960 [Gordonia jinhuaensis]|uniref:Phage integrase, N-terminal SAM-like domain n=1 Tax=Gordonia jinhuaensis TaxID=1517702 RepID=A0A916X132_9ACTN|nr:hypothetical protein GCM10011489_37660 [Gordonia jinhuaensis]
MASVSSRDREHLLAELEARNLAPRTVKHAWLALSAVLKYATRDGAIIASPTEKVDFSAGHTVGDREAFSISR